MYFKPQYIDLKLSLSKQSFEICWIYLAVFNVNFDWFIVLSEVLWYYVVYCTKMSNYSDFIVFPLILFYHLLYPLGSLPQKCWAFIQQSCFHVLQYFITFKTVVLWVDIFNHLHIYLLVIFTLIFDEPKIVLNEFVGKLVVGILFDFLHDVFANITWRS